MRRFVNLSMLVAATLLCLSGQVHADDEYPVIAEEYVYCTVCHGAQLMGNPVIRAPRLSKMEDWYAKRQLDAFKNGWRGTHAGDEIGMEMQPMAAALSDKQIAEVVEFITAASSAKPSVTIQGDVENGRRHYATCTACHGADGQGIEALGGPDLTVTNDWYLAEQLKKFRNGSRGAHPEDTYGNQMRSATAVLPDDDSINDVVSYINTL